MADSLQLEKSKKSLYLLNRLTDFDKIWYGDAAETAEPDWPLKLPDFRNPGWCRTVTILK